MLDSGSFNLIEIEKVSIETELPEPYNPARNLQLMSLSIKRIAMKLVLNYKEIKNKYNCTFHLTLFSIQGLRQCVLDYKVLKEFSETCRKESHLETCFSEKFTFNSKTDLKKTFTVFIFNFRDLGSLNKTQIPKTDPFTFLNNIGDDLSLFMGIAFPNLIKFFQI